VPDRALALADEVIEPKADIQPDRLPRLNVCRFIHIAIAQPAMI
jgi:hypothetical protein